MIQTFAILTLYEAVVSLAFIWKRQKATPLFIAFSIQNIAGFVFGNIALVNNIGVFPGCGIMYWATGLLFGLQNAGYSRFPILNYDLVQKTCFSDCS